MKNVKKLISIIMVLAMLFCFTAMFASAKDKIISWNEFDEKLVYSGTLKTGKNEFSKIGNFAFDFTADKGGLYSIQLKVVSNDFEYGYTYALSDSISNGSPKGVKYPLSSEEYENLFMLKKGEKEFFGVSLEGKIKSYSITIKYLGEITDLKLSKTNLRLFCDIDFQKEGKKTICNINVPTTVSTSSGKKFTTSLSFPIQQNELKSGKYTFEASILNFKKKITVKIYTASDYIKSIKTSKNFVAPTVYLDKKGNVDYYDFSDSLSFSVKYVLKDGKTVSNTADITAFRFIAPDGNTVNLRDNVVKGSDGKYYWVAVADNNKQFKISEAKIEGNYKPEPPKKDNDNSILAIIKQLFASFKKFLKAFI